MVLGVPDEQSAGVRGFARGPSGGLLRLFLLGSSKSKRKDQIGRSGRMRYAQGPFYLPHRHVTGEVRHQFQFRGGKKAGTELCRRPALLLQLWREFRTEARAEHFAELSSHFRPFRNCESHHAFRLTAARLVSIRFFLWIRAGPLGRLHKVQRLSHRRSEKGSQGLEGAHPNNQR